MFKPKSNTIKRGDDDGRRRLRSVMGSNVSSLGVAGLQQAVKLPKGEDKNEWYAVNIVDFINGVTALYDPLRESCTESTCPVMNAGKQFEYLWMDKDSADYKKPVAVPAVTYINLLMNWIDDQINDDAVFPTDPEKPFPKNFEKTVKNIFKRLFRVYAHIYCAHFEQVKSMGQEAHLNVSITFMYFVFEFDLIPSKELVALKDAIGTILGESYASKIK
ncbi:MOB kinase activator [Acrasis kona]|uniref:MOB kinase activator n=1 Tax=Acrasis kona TaxID=1008807 RepID=A0AAW2ZI21_9EUKA